MVEVPGKKERPGLTLGKPGSCCPQFLVEPTWTTHSHTNREQKIQTEGVGKDEDVDVSRARHELALGALPAPLMPRKGTLWEQKAAWRTKLSPIWELAEVWTAGAAKAAKLTPTQPWPQRWTREGQKGYKYISPRNYVVHNMSFHWKNS